MCGVSLALRFFIVAGWDDGDSPVPGVRPGKLSPPHIAPFLPNHRWSSYVSLQDTGAGTARPRLCNDPTTCVSTSPSALPGRRPLMDAGTTANAGPAAELNVRRSSS